MEYHVAQHRKNLENLLKSAYNKANICRCMARIHDNTQCTRKCKNDSIMLCGSHQNSLPYGRIDDDEITQTKHNEKKSNNHKKKNHDHYDPENIDLSLYVKTAIININGIEYLIDENNIIYEYNDTNTILGQKLHNNQIKWF